MAGSTPSRQKRLIRAYLRTGHRIVDYKWSKGAGFGCVIFSKTLQGKGVKSTFFRRLLRKIKYCRRAVEYRLSGRYGRTSDI